jgi:hypothetical protein
LKEHPFKLRNSMYHFTQNSTFMKKQNLLHFSGLLLLLFTLSIQSVSAGDVLIKKDDDYNIPDNNTRAPVRIALTASQNENDVTLNFLYPVGTTQITVENENGDVVYQQAVDTYTTLDAYIDTQNFEGGIYTLKISYGSTNLVGEFEL